MWIPSKIADVDCALKDTTLRSRDTKASLSASKNNRVVLSAILYMEVPLHLFPVSLPLHLFPVMWILWRSLLLVTTSKFSVRATEITSRIVSHLSVTESTFLILSHFIIYDIFLLKTRIPIFLCLCSIFSLVFTFFC